MTDYINIYRDELLKGVIPFWEKHSIDRENGGFFTCLDRTGKVYDTDKFIWLQARQVWMFATLYNTVEQKSEWLNIAKQGADFLLKHGMDSEGNWYFSLNREGQPLVQPYNIFSDCFAAMAFGALYKAVPNEEYALLAQRTFGNILKRRANTKGKYNKAYPGTRELKNFALPMILCNLSLEMEHLLDKQLVDELIEDVIHEVMDVFYNQDIDLILENVHLDGSLSDSFDGRLINPGHGIEAMWFIMDLGVRQNNAALIEKARTIMMRLLDYGWDQEHGGILYFMDRKGHPMQQLEWDQKLWWVHLESLVGLSKAYAYQPNEEVKDWFDKIHNYAWTHFRDEAHGEWFGYLHRDGSRLNELKGGKWKGCFHVPRGLMQVWKTLEKSEKRASKNSQVAPADN
ncbi:AGE family epimerase/isomerase [Marinoscillum furvescens]|uniref:N-acylglucosamine 2-epimerase n=1 Tax=Marinoscillum furvescens DSM 4134 TaxID=1122208 RepID=A0A3D9KXE2_MARFU|nr:AGE family epimerase/isomerase [Marinoscillum furvescens]RED93607.1 N-acylglucosamine 2-epimerase [Marinoscillum furvescens DSM 4134]